MATYPNGYFSWANRVDLVDIDYAEDINAVANDLVATEATIGLNPQTEKAPIVGSAKTYASVDARISDVNAGNPLPVVSLTSPLVHVRSNAATYATYNKAIDTNGMFNGRDITIKASGWYSVYVGGQFIPNPWSNGFATMMLFVNNLFASSSTFRWDFPNRGLWPEPYLDLAGHTHIAWEGACHTGDRLSVLYINGTFCDPTPVTSNVLKASFRRKLTNFVTG